jgi:hypothetical protein
MRKPDRANRLAGILLLSAATGLGVAVLLGACSKSGDKGAESPRVVVVTPSEAAAPGEFRGAEAFVRDHAGPGGVALHAVFPDRLRPGDAAGIAAFVSASAGDPRTKAVLVAPALAGTAEGFRRAKEARPDLFCIAAGSTEDPLLIESASDLVVDLDRVYRAYLIPWAAKRMGAGALVAAYTREEGQDPESLRECAIMSAASADLGLKFAAKTAPAGVDPAAFVRAGSGSWLRELGPDAALYCSSPVLAAPVLAGAIAGGGMVVDVAGEATRSSYASALGLDLSSAKGDPSKERRLVEAAVEALGGRGRFGMWDAPFAEASVEGLGEFAVRASSGAARKDEIKDIVAALDARSRGAAWIADYDIDPDTGVRSANHVLLRQDTYVLGKGYLQSALQAAPAKYLSLRADAD